MAKKITVIPSVSESLHTQMKPRIRVCGYARVSTASMAQADSYAAQVGYYTERYRAIPYGNLPGYMQTKESREPRRKADTILMK